MARKITLVYLLVGIAWIVFGATVLQWLDLESHWSPEALARFELLKGIFYVLITSGLLYLYLRRTLRKLQVADEKLIQANKELNRQRHNLSTLLNSSRSSIWSIDQHYRLISANKTFYAAFSEVIGKEVCEGDLLIFPDLDAGLLQRWIDYYARGLKGETIEIIDIVEISPSIILHVELRFFPIFDEDNTCIGLSCYVQDVTERVEALHRIEAQNQQLAEIAWVQSHKLRVPVAHILGLVSVINRQNASDPFNLLALEKIEQAASELDKVIHEIVADTQDLRKKEA